MVSASTPMKCHSDDVVCDCVDADVCVALLSMWRPQAVALISMWRPQAVAFGTTKDN